MLIAIVLDRPLAEAKAPVDDPAAFTREMTRILLAKAKPSTYRANDSKPAGSGFFSVQRRMASARSFNMFPSMLHMGLIN